MLNLKDNYSVIPIYKEIYADAFTPINLLRKIAGKSEQNSFFLKVSRAVGKSGQDIHSSDSTPRQGFRRKTGTLTVTGEGARVVKTAKPYDALRKYLADYKTPHFKDVRTGSQVVLSAISVTQ